MSKFINPFTDVGFKRIFGQEVSKDLLVDFLNSLMEGERHIEDVTFLDKEQLPENARDRGLIYDVYCRTSTGENIIVEMQNKDQLHFKERALLYLSKAIVEQSKRGDEGRLYEIDAVYGIFFMNFHSSNFDRRFRTDVALMDTATHEVFSDKIRMTYLQLPEFRKDVDECETTFDRWIYILKHMTVLERLPWAAQHAVFQKLSQICETAALSKIERMQYDESRKIYLDNLATLEKSRLDGVEEGMEKGMEKGLRQGMEQGIVQGRQSAQMDIARKMKSEGMTHELIEKITGLTPKEIAEI